MIYQFWIPFVFLLITIVFLDRKYGMLRDITQPDPKPYSWSRVQLAWWTLIILSAFIAVVWTKGQVPNLYYSTLVLLGISAITTAAARMIDVSDQANNLIVQRNSRQDGFIIDILSDQNGVNVHRLQSVAFNLVFGIWFISTVLHNLADAADICSIYKGQPDLLAQCTQNPLDFIMPALSDNNLILLGLSSATYAAMKTTENKLQDPTPPAGSKNVAGIAGVNNPAPIDPAIPVQPGINPQNS